MSDFDLPLGTENWDDYKERRLDVHITLSLADFGGDPRVALQAIKDMKGVEKISYSVQHCCWHNDGINPYGLICCDCGEKGSGGTHNGVDMKFRAGPHGPYAPAVADERGERNTDAD